MNEKDRNSGFSAEPEPVLLVDVRGAFDRGWWASRKSEELAHLDPERAAACSTLMVLLPILSSERLDESYRLALFAWDSGYHKTNKQRPPKPPGFAEALAYFKQLLPTLVGAAHCTAPNHEADDVVATAAARAAAEGRRSCVVSGDKDLQQLVNRQVTYYCLNRKSILSAQTIMDRWNVRHPAQFAVRLAVVGDTQDKIPGVVKWGEGKWNTKVMATAPAGCDLGELVEHVANIIPKGQISNFYAALECTLLQDDVPNVPDPAPINPVALEFLSDEGLDPIRLNYARFIGAMRGDRDIAMGVASEVDREY